MPSLIANPHVRKASAPTRSLLPDRLGQLLVGASQTGHGHPEPDEDAGAVAEGLSRRTVHLAGSVVENLLRQEDLAPEK
jgi:hypothetical protein